MITRAQDYQLTVPVGVIDGGILPARDVAADGSSSVLRAEDLCFSIEALKERLAINDQIDVSSLNLPNPKLTVKRDDWVPLWYGLASYIYTGYDGGGVLSVTKRLSVIDETAVFTNCDLDIPVRQVTYLSNCFPGVVLSSRYVPGDRPGYVWYNDFVRGFYYDLRCADRLLLGGGLWPIRGTLLRTYHDEDNNITTSEDVSNFKGHAYFDYVYRVSSGGRKRRYYGYTGGGMSFSLPYHQLATSAELLIVDSITATYHPYDDSRREEVARFHNYALTWDRNGVVTVPASAWKHTETDLEALAAEFNLSVPFVTTSLTVPAYLSIMPEAIWLVVRYNFRTEIRSINWQWVP